MTDGELARLAAIALTAAEEAAAMVRVGFRSRPRAESKGPHDLVTEFDRASEALLEERLSALAPGIPVIGEEQAGVSATVGRAGPVWYVDPLDGTTNFVHGHPFWCVAVGLMHDDAPVAGAIVAPSLDLRWVAWRAPGGGGTRERGVPTHVGATRERGVPTHVGATRERGVPTRGEARRNGAPCGVSATAAIGDAMIATGFPSVRDRAPANNFDAFMAVKRRAQAVRRCGSAAIDLCLVADGTYDGFWERHLHAWDVAAASAAVLAAGGTITALDGGPPNWHVGHIVASNGRIHGDIVKLVQASDGG